MFSRKRVTDDGSRPRVPRLVPEGQLLHHHRRDFLRSQREARERSEGRRRREWLSLFLMFAVTSQRTKQKYARLSFLSIKVRTLNSFKI